MWWEIKLNSKRLKKMIEEELDFYQRGYRDIFTLIALGRAYMYLGEYEEGRKYMLKCIEKSWEIVEEARVKYGYESASVALNIARTAKYRRWIGELEQMKEEFAEASRIFGRVYEKKREEGSVLALRPWGHPDFYVLWATAEYYTGNLQKAVEIKRLMEGRRGVIPGGFAECILKKDPEGIKKIMSNIIGVIKEEKIPPHGDELVDDPWHWYEEGKKILGFPSIFDVYDKTPPIFNYSEFENG
ncbi:tetratricopeptide repeat protein [Caldicellulosiruptor morganii]|uniref:Tetratricopeptide repeat protein n=1 Tax=Caldicellulosiruptor morganii TaxID=1387555 RepID=A0ABY7BSA4_9FIRM|nr:hypothetical protein [Caldicellulosiruptor morganii]WAM34449.1 hypothetical protein OTK00_000652 [Caldicellulosiruptor morganii]